MRLLTLFLVCFLASCAPKNAQKGALLTPISTLSWASLVGQPFELSAFRTAGKEITLPATRRPTIQFRDGGGVNGLAGVNRYSTAAEIDGRGGISWKGSPAATKMAGPPEAMALEDNFLQSLQSVTKISLAGGKLQLASADGSTRLEFSR